MDANSVIDLRPLHHLISLLPLEAEPTCEVTLKTIESLSAACFHAAFPMRMAQAEAWIASHPEPKRPKGSELLSLLGLTKPAEPIRRRI